MSEKKINVAGMALQGGRKDLFYLSLLEYYPQQKRWFLRSLKQVKNEETKDGNESIRKWITENNVSTLVVDCPLTMPACYSCKKKCPGQIACEEESVKEVNKRIRSVLKKDQDLKDRDPKQYERDRIEDNEYDHHKDILKKDTSEYILSRSFKNRLKKGFLPYWNRSIDYWIWKHYYDPLLKFFSYSYDSFGNSSMMVLSRFAYLRRHFPKKMIVLEGNVNIGLVELLKNKIILKRDIMNLHDHEQLVDARLHIVRDIEKNLKIFIYDKDLEEIIRKPRAFSSFILSVIGRSAILNKSRILPDWVGEDKDSFSIPLF